MTTHDDVVRRWHDRLIGTTTEATMLGAVAQSYGFTLHQWLIGLPLTLEKRQEMTAKLLERPPHPEDPT